jgi:hypothetical protein
MKAIGQDGEAREAFGRRAMVLSTLWIFVVVNYLYCDVEGLMDPVLLRQYLAGVVNHLQINAGFLLAAAILLEIPMAMILLSRVLRYRANRIANIVAGTIMTLVQAATLFVGGGPTIYYAFFSAVEIAGTAFIVWYAFTWREAASEVVAA